MIYAFLHEKWQVNGHKVLSEYIIAKRAGLQAPCSAGVGFTTD